ncbi:MAG: DEAD/DEAH box helicase [Bdellovibrionales bacterium]|nr:DEAD/DEAH box helicase [Bdellovibrionales bacterium]
MKFSEIQLHPLLQANLDKIQFLECTKIQEQSMPWIRSGKDVAGLAQTGTGKTGAFFIPLIDRLLKALKPDPATAESETVPFNEWKKKQFVLVLVPTRELAEQVQDISTKLLEGTGLSSVSIYGGTTYEKQVAALKNGVEFVVATPGRLIDLYKEHVCDLGLVRAIVFDEADRMFDMGFKDDMKFILKRVPRDRQFTVFSATLNFDVLNVAYEFGSDPVEVNISRDQAKADNVKDHILHVGQQEKPQYLLSLLKKTNPRQAIIFSNFKHNVEKLTRFLTSNGIPAVGISSLMTQAQRLRVMEQFRGENDRNILVATDVAARGLDILGVDLVVNYELPDDAENYVHRIGRTGRAGQTGNALSMVSDRDVDALQRIEEYLKHKVEVLWLDDAEIVKEFEPFPRDEERFKRPGQGRGRFEGREGGRSGDRGGRGGPRREGGRGNDRGPRREGRGGRDRDRDQRRERGDRDQQRPLPAEAANTGEQQPRREAHRDRHTGRHRDQQAGGGQAREGQRRDGNRGGRGRDRNRGGSRDGQPREQRGNGHPRAHGGDQRRPQGGSGSRIQRPGQRPAAVAAKAGIGAKVGGFFKKLFGG